MGIFDRFKKQEPSTQIINVEPQKNSTEFLTEGFKFSAVQVPKPKEDRMNDWILNGDKNYFPKELLKLKDNSGIHSAILESSSRLTVGNGFMYANTREESDAIYDSMDIITKAKIDQFVKNINPNETADEIFFKWIRDYKIFGYCFLEVIWNKDYTRPIQFNYIDASRMALGKMNEQEEITHFYYSRNWDDTKKNPPIKIPVFNADNAKKNKEGNQIIYLSNKINGVDYYGQPGYTSALTWIKADGIMADTNFNNISNGFSPNVIVKYFQQPSNEQKESISSNFKKTMTGVGQKILFLFWTGKDDAPTVEPLDIKNFDDRMNSLNDLIVQQIVSSHRIHPSLMGIQTPGKLGYSSELQQALNIYNSSVIQPERKKFEEVLTMLFNLNGFNFNIFFEDINLLGGAEQKSLLDSLGIGGVTALKETVVDPALTQSQKVAMLTSVFGLDETAANNIIFGTQPQTNA